MKPYAGSMKGTWVVLLLVIASTAGAAIQADGSDCPVEIGESDEPGQELANVVGAQESVVAREIERRGFNATLENASNPEEQATVIATEIERIDLRVATLETCRDALVDAREEGDLTAEEYRERAETLEPEIVDARERLDRAAEAASDLPSTLRVEADIGAERFKELSDRVDDLQTWVDRPGRAIESVDTGETESTPADSTPDESTVSEPTEVQPTTTDVISDGPEETTAPSTETPTGTSTPESTPTTESPNDETQDDDGDGADENEGDWPLGTR